MIQNHTFDQNFLLFYFVFNKHTVSFCMAVNKVCFFILLGVSKKLLRIAQNKDSEKLQKWYRSIKKPHILDSGFFFIRARASGKVDVNFVFVCLFVFKYKV